MGMYNWTRRDAIRKEELYVNEDGKICGVITENRHNKTWSAEVYDLGYGEPTYKHILIGNYLDIAPARSAVERFFENHEKTQLDHKQRMQLNG